jgi:hypothetical protein
MRRTHEPTRLPARQGLWNEGWYSGAAAHLHAATSLNTLNQMKTVVTSLALAAIFGASAHAQTAGSGTGTQTTAGGEQHCLTQADAQTWSSLGLTTDQVQRVKEIQMRYKGHSDRGTENTMRGTRDDRATPTTGTTGSGTGTTGTGTTGTTGTGTTGTGTTGTGNTGTGTTGTGTTGTGTTGTGTTGTGTTGTGTTGTGTTGTGTTGTGTTGTTGTGTTGTTGSHTHGTGAAGSHTHGTGTAAGTSGGQLGYDDTQKEAMERELRTVLTTAQYERYQEWCQEQDATRGDRNDMDR